MSEMRMSEIRISRVDISSIDADGFWLDCRGEALYLPFALFPWFRHATIAQLCRVDCIGASCLYWPALDLELALGRIRNPMAVAQYAGGMDG